LEQTVSSLVEGTTMAVNRFTLLARPCPYSKRWFTPELKIQQREVNKARRKWQESCATKGREDVTTIPFFVEMRSRRREWTRAIERTKATHWKEFLDKASLNKVWKATPYLGPRDNYASIPALKVGQAEFSGNQDNARILMNCFFLKMANPTPEAEPSSREEIPRQEAAIECSRTFAR
jgi:hypothetical protein